MRGSDGCLGECGKGKTCADYAMHACDAESSDVTAACNGMDPSDAGVDAADNGSAKSNNRNTVHILSMGITFLSEADYVRRVLQPEPREGS